MQMPSGRLEAKADGSAADAEQKDKAVAPAQPSQVDVSSLLGMMAPGLQSVPDLHSQWFQSNKINTSVPMNSKSVAPAALSLQQVMDVPVPDIPVRIPFSSAGIRLHCCCMLMLVISTSHLQKACLNPSADAEREGPGPEPH
jgi:hypothetical protein